jgi:hypothetical protein
MAAYLTLAQFRLRTVMPGGDVDAIEAAAPGFLLQLLEDETEWLKARLRKRYAVESFDASPPAIVLRWLVKMVTPQAYEKRGWNPSSEQDKAILDAGDAARAEVKEAADSEVGLFDLPLRQDAAGSGISKGGPFGYAEASPYTWTDRQAEAVRNGE